MSSSDLPRFLRANKPDASLQTALGFFNPAGMHIELLRAPDDHASPSSLEGMAVLLHERMHWLQFVGTHAGVFSAYLSALQAGLLLDPGAWQTDPLAADALPLLESDRITPVQRTLWLSCEQMFVAVFGTTRTYFEEVTRQGGGFRPETISTELRAMGSIVMENDDRWEQAQQTLWAGVDFPRTTVALLHQEGQAIGAGHLMETAARMNEAFKRAEYAAQGLLAPVDHESLFFPPYSTAHDLFYEVVGRPPSAVLNMALCVLADWALNDLLPPLFPLHGTFDTPRLPGPVFAALCRALDPDRLPRDAPDGPVTFAADLAGAIYHHVGAATGMPSPLETARVMTSLTGGLAEKEIADLLYEASDRPGYPQPKDSVGRLRYVTRLAHDAARTRLSHPSFFAFPYAHYHLDRKLFHDLYDPIQPPLWGIGPKRLVPTVDDADWFGFFFLAALQEEAAMAAAYGSAEDVAARLQHYAGTYVGPQAARHMIHTATVSLFGDGDASRQILGSITFPAER